MPDTTQGLWHYLAYKYRFTAFLYKALLHLPALKMDNALACEAQLSLQKKSWDAL